MRSRILKVQKIQNDENKPHLQLSRTFFEHMHFLLQSTAKKPKFHVSLCDFPMVMTKNAGLSAKTIRGNHFFGAKNHGFKFLWKKNMRIVLYAASSLDKYFSCSISWEDSYCKCIFYFPKIVILWSTISFLVPNGKLK